MPERDSLPISRHAKRRMFLIFGAGTALTAAAFGIAPLWRGLVAEKASLQQRYAEMHEFLAGDGDPADTPFAGGLTQAQLTQRDSVTSAIAGEANDLPWDILAKASLKTSPNGIDAEPVYTEPIRALDRTMEQARGYIFPLDQAEKQTHFLLSPYPPSCPFCLPAGPSELIEVKLKRPIAFTYAPIRVRGNFQLLKGLEAKDGMFYRMEEASELPTP